MNNSSQILRELQDLKKTWKIQGFRYTNDQQNRYDELMGLRRAFIQYWEENDMVWVGPSTAGKVIEEN
jgi:hypothetical protein